MKKGTAGASRSVQFSRISKCRMEAVALDGLDMLMEPLAKANPNAKAPICQKGNDVSGFRHFGEA
jgi:hypothetical protein